MYLRVTRRRNRDGSVAEYYQLAETRWDPAKRHPSAPIIHNFGRADAEQREGLLRLARSITRMCNDGVESPAELGAPGEKIALEWARPLGTVHVVRALWEALGIGEILRGHQRRRGRQAPHELALFAMVANRLSEPLSKLACHAHWLATRVYLPEAEALTLDQLYLALDFLGAAPRAATKPAAPVTATPNAAPQTSARVDARTPPAGEKPAHVTSAGAAAPRSASPPKPETASEKSPAPAVASAPVKPLKRDPATPPASQEPPVPQEVVAKLHLQVLVYSEVPSGRLVFINNQKYVEGQRIDANL